MDYISNVSYIFMTLDGMMPPYETWSVDKPSIASISMKDGSELKELLYQKPSRTCVIKAVKPGVATVTLERQGVTDLVSATCNIIVYDDSQTTQPTETITPTETKKPEAYKTGDVDKNSFIDAKDALEVLKVAANLISFSEDQKKLADLNCDTFINSEDALEILKIAVKIK